MELKTAVHILVQQIADLSNLVFQLQSQANNAGLLVDAENNSIVDISAQIHAACASMGVIMTAINSQSVIVQQAIDKVADASK